MHITDLEIRNLRSIASAAIELNHAGRKTELMYPNVNVFLGPNGSGKTTVLRAAALAALGVLMSGGSGYVSDGMVRIEAKGKSRGGKLNAQTAATLALHDNDIRRPSWRHSIGSGPLRVQTRIAQHGTAELLSPAVEPKSAGRVLNELLFDKRNAGYFMVGYGSTRRVEASSRVDESARIKARLPRYERVAGLFEDHLALIPLSFWLPNYEKSNPGQHKQVVALINRLLPPSCRMRNLATDTDAGRENLFEMNGITVPFRALSDGYRAYVGWIGDMLFHLCSEVSRNARIEQARGVIMVDEIDLHLHPEWQRIILPTLARELPQIQFIVTTHSPLVVGSLEDGNLFILTDKDGATTIERRPERVHGRNSEEILLSPYFGLESTRAPDTAAALRYLSEQAVAGNATASMDYLRLLSGGMSRKDIEDISVKIAARGAPPEPTPAKRAPAKRSPAKRASSGKKAR